MKIFLRKSLLVLLSILTLGFVSPSQFDQYVKENRPSDQTAPNENNLTVSNVQIEELGIDHAKFQSNTKLDRTEQNIYESPEKVSSINSDAGVNVLPDEAKFDREKFIDELVYQAEIQSFQKFGTKIKPVIQGEFREIILPNIEAAINQTAAKFPEEDLKTLSITEQPGGGNSEKIFNVINEATGKAILKFHVRRDNPPQEGYWFNFHYHTIFDKFQIHHDLGSIYWAKDTPPKWMN